MSTEKTQGHSKLPWRISERDDARVFEANGFTVADTIGPHEVADAALIVRAVNNHAALVSALTDMVATWDAPMPDTLRGKIAEHAVIKRQIAVARAALSRAKE